MGLVQPPTPGAPPSRGHSSAERSRPQEKPAISALCLALRYRFVQLHKVLPSLCECTRKEPREDSLDETENQDVANRRERDDQDDRHGNLKGVAIGIDEGQA